MFIKNFGLFWRLDEVDWNPGTGTKGGFRLLGRQGMKRPGIRLADFRNQLGIYILYGNHGAYYVGLTKKKGLGERLKDHLTDDHKGQWNQFSWFGFCAVKKTGKDNFGLCRLRPMAQAAIGSPESVISDVEALLIRAMGLSNIRQMNFTVADEWYRVKAHEIQQYLDKTV
jgi:hypothetical protein